MSSGLQLAGLMPSQVTNPTKLIVAASDGKVCPASCADLEATATYVKSLGNYLLTFGYNLSGDDATTMDGIASDAPGGRHLFVNSGSGGDLYTVLVNEISAACDPRMRALIRSTTRTTTEA